MPVNTEAVSLSLNEGRVSSTSNFQVLTVFLPKAKGFSHIHRLLTPITTGCNDKVEVAESGIKVEPQSMKNKPIFPHAFSVGIFCFYLFVFLCLFLVICFVLKVRVFTSTRSSYLNCKLN